jgi:hypothetical protein
MLEIKHVKGALVVNSRPIAMAAAMQGMLNQSRVVSSSDMGIVHDKLCLNA